MGVLRIGFNDAPEFRIQHANLHSDKIQEPE